MTAISSTNALGELVMRAKGHKAAERRPPIMRKGTLLPTASEKDPHMSWAAFVVRFIAAWRKPSSVGVAPSWAA